MKEVKMKKTVIIVIAVFCLMLQPLAFAYDELNNEQLGKVVAGSQATDISNELTRIPLYLSRPNKSLDGELVLLRSPISTTGSLVIKDGAQSNLRSLININAVNSPIQVLLNLNVNINSSVGVLEQLNIQGRL
jgi:hypothetical protein